MDGNGEEVEGSPDEGNLEEEIRIRRIPRLLFRGTSDRLIVFFHLNHRRRQITEDPRRFKTSRALCQA